MEKFSVIVLSLIFLQGSTVYGSPSENILEHLKIEEIKKQNISLIITLLDSLAKAQKHFAHEYEQIYVDRIKATTREIFFNITKFDKNDFENSMLTKPMETFVTDQSRDISHFRLRVEAMYKLCDQINGRYINEAKEIQKKVAELEKDQNNLEKYLEALSIYNNKIQETDEKFKSLMVNCNIQIQESLDKAKEEFPKKFKEGLLEIIEKEKKH